MQRHIICLCVEAMEECTCRVRRSRLKTAVSSCGSSGSWIRFLKARRGYGGGDAGGCGEAWTGVCVLEAGAVEVDGTVFADGSTAFADGSYCSRVCFATVAEKEMPRVASQGLLFK